MKITISQGQKLVISTDDSGDVFIVDYTNEKLRISASLPDSSGRGGKKDLFVSKDLPPCNPEIYRKDFED